ncbi:hypothetical protein CVT24_008985 [Panaeolus cyanescens]|uniref:Uncharacterized protein n=1 Tax=Panaeolus cyanescens TaxID=181874 RepID=A0A409YAR2_9AGAR|nr:hypothetical protein CVT24_008985 [Panaeolus cyanescens]
MGLPPQNHTAWKVGITILHILVLMMCIVRLGHRARLKRLWWDDYILVIPLALDVVYLAYLWAKYKTAVDFLADVVLIAFPITMLRKVQIPGEQRVLVIALFCGSLLTLIASLSYCTVWYLIFRIGTESRLIFVMFGHMQADMSLISANLLVVVMMLYRKFKQRTEANRARPRPRDQVNPEAGSPGEKTTVSRLHPPTEYTLDSNSADSSAPSYTVTSADDSHRQSALSSSSPSRSESKDYVSTGLGSLLSFLSSSSSRHSNSPSNQESATSSAPEMTLSSWDFSSFHNRGNASNSQHQTSPPSIPP